MCLRSLKRLVLCNPVFGLSGQDYDISNIGSKRGFGAECSGFN